MKKSIETYNNIKLNKRVSASSTTTTISTSTISTKSTKLLENFTVASTSLDTISTQYQSNMANIKRPFIFKSKASKLLNTNNDKSTFDSLPTSSFSSSSSSTSTNQDTKISSKSKFTLKRASNSSLDEDEDDEDIFSNRKKENTTVISTSSDTTNGKKLKLKKLSPSSSLNTSLNKSKSTDTDNNTDADTTMTSLNDSLSPTRFTRATRSNSKTIDLPPPQAPSAKIPTPPSKSSSNSVKASTSSDSKKSTNSILNKIKFDLDEEDDDEADDILFRNKLINKNKRQILMSQPSTSTSASTSSSNFDSIKKPDSPASSSSSCSTSAKPPLTSSSSVIKRKIFSSSRNIESKSIQQPAYQLNFNDEFDNQNSNSSEDDVFSKDKLTKTSVNSNDSNSKLNNHKQNIIDKKNGLVLSKKDNEIISLRNTRKAYECEELGETQAFLDDLFFLMDGLNSRHELSERCLCAIKLAEQCLSSEFRMSLRSSSDYLNKIFKLLNDSSNYKSLALCTSLIMFALTQDKLIVEIDKSTFHLIISILNMNDQCMDDEDQILYKRTYDRCKKLFEQLILTNSDCLDQTLASTEQNHNNSDLNENIDDTIDVLFNSELLALECVLNLNLLNKNKNNETDMYKNELRELKVLDRLLNILKLLIETFKNNKKNGKNFQLINKFSKYLHLIETVTQQASFSSSSNSQSPIKSTTQSLQASPTTSSSSCSSRIIQRSNSCTNIEIYTETHLFNDAASSTNDSACPQHLITQTATTINQNYLFDYKKTFLVDLIKESLNVFFDELELLSGKASSNVSVNKTILSNAIKQIFLVMINLTLYNENTSKIIAKDENLVDLLFKCIAKVKDYLNENEQFDVLVTVFGILLNIFDTNFKKPESMNLVKYLKAFKCSSFDIIFKLYKAKEAQVSLAETDQDNQLKQLNQEIENQNVENINLTVMNSINKASKHMEEHIIAAHSALLIGYMMLSEQYFNNINSNSTSKSTKSKKSNSPNKLIDFDSIKLEMKDSSFKKMSQIIVKFLEFMKMMKVSGFSVDEHIKIILDYLDQLN